MYIVIAVAIAAIAGIYSLFSRRLEDARQQLLKFEAELHVLKHEMAHRDMEIKKTLTKSSTVADDVAYTWDVYARKRLGKGWR